MSSLVPSEPPHQPVYLDRPQRLGILPTMRFWNQPDVWRQAGPLVAPVVGVWIFVASLWLSGVLSPLMVGLVSGAGIFLLIGLLERYVRRGMRARQQAALAEPRGPE